MDDEEEAPRHNTEAEGSKTLPTTRPKRGSSGQKQFSLSKVWDKRPADEAASFRQASRSPSSPMSRSGTVAGRAYNSVRGMLSPKSPGSMKGRLGEQLSAGRELSGGEGIARKMSIVAAKGSSR